MSLDSGHGSGHDSEPDHPGRKELPESHTEDDLDENYQDTPEPAFPGGWDEGGGPPWHVGMSLRDYFAASSPVSPPPLDRITAVP